MTTLTVLDRPYGVRIWGQPVPQGSMTCVGRGGFHNVQPSNAKALKPWRKLIAAAGRRLMDKTGGTLTGPVGVEVTLTVPRPPSVAPGSRPWPTARGKNALDVDKGARAVLDGLQDSGLVTDDAQVVELIARKVYPDTPDAPDALPRPGAVIRVYPIT